LAIFLEAQKLLFLQVPGTASTSLETALLSQAAGKQVGGKHATVDELAADDATKSYISEASLTVCIVRNHFDWFYSEWLRSRTRWVYVLDGAALTWGPLKRLEIKNACAMEFIEWMNWRLDAYQRDKPEWTLFGSFTKSAGKTFKMEEIEKLSSWLDDDYNLQISLVRENVTKKTGVYWQYYDKSTRERIEYLYKDELAALGYVF
jgi:hypothetical protein